MSDNLEQIQVSFSGNFAGQFHAWNKNQSNECPPRFYRHRRTVIVVIVCQTQVSVPHITEHYNRAIMIDFVVNWR